jgi:hypothetical protein
VRDGWNRRWLYSHPINKDDLAIRCCLSWLHIFSGVARTYQEPEEPWIMWVSAKVEDHLIAYDAP